MRRKMISMLCVLTLLCSLCSTAAFAATGHFTPDPQTAYAKQFIQRCEGQQWFMDAVEKLMNENQRSLNTVSDSLDLDIIKSIGLKGQTITGQIPSAIGELKELRYLFLSDNHLSGSLPAELFTLPKLQNVDISNNDYSGAIPAEFGTMPALTHLSLRGNQYTGAIPDAILANTSIQYLDVSGNKLAGALPTGLNQMTSLQYLAVADNNWTAGALPDLSSLANLKTLSAWNCSLTGAIPESIYTLSGLQVLDLDSNNLTGEISSDIANLTNLQQLSLANNQFRGTVPEELGALPKLTTLDISGNKLRGKLPASVAAYDTVYAQNNYMTGEVLKDLTNNEGNFADGASTAQYQLSASRETVQLSRTGTVNLYALLKNAPLSSGIPAKALLYPDEYELVYDSAKVEITTDANGIYAKALTELPKADNIGITIQISANADSDYSKVRLNLTTESVPSGGVGGGGGTVTPPTTQEVSHRLYINGFPDGSFGPTKAITREQTAKMLIDALEIATEPSANPRFSDVQPDRWSYAWVEAAAREGYVQGYTDGSFGPGKPITRAEMAATLVRIAAKQALPMSSETKVFSDVEDGQWYSDSVHQAVLYGLISGYEDGTFRPNQNITRAEAVVMINRLLGRDYKTAEQLHSMDCPFPDVAESYWAYGDIMEAAITHEH